MFYWTVIISLLGIYILLSMMTILFFMNNLFFWRSKDYDIPFGGKAYCSKSKLGNPKIRYWKCDNQNQNDNNDWVVLLHSWGRSSNRMISQAQIYWDSGYSLIFIDARSHGQSQFTKVSHGFLYAEDVNMIIEKENIIAPIIHGLSAGAIAATVFAYKHNVRAVILEALVKDYQSMMKDTLRYMHLPKILFGWIVWILLKLKLPFDEYSPINTLKHLKAPTYLIHGANDKWFTFENHFYPNLNSMKSLENVTYWIVPGSDHSHMSLHPDYKGKLIEFIQQIENKPILINI